MDERELKASDLSQFMGTENYYEHSSGYTYTDGVRYLAEKGGAYWLLDEILLHTKFKQELQAWGSWTLTVKDSTAVLRCEDGNNNILHKTKIEYTDFPLGEARLWFTGGVLMLPSEY
jgi:hypothetical protein